MPLQTFPADEAYVLRAKFWNSGYFIRPRALGRSAVEYLGGKVPTLECAPIFNSIYDEDNNDNKRLMARIPLETTNLHKRITTLVQSICPQWDIYKWTVIKSLPGGAIQDVHRDFPTFETAESLGKKNWVQASLFLAINDNTELDIFPESFAGAVLESKRVRVEIPKGGMLVFRGDLPHAGISYESEHYRIHCYLRVRGIEQKDNSPEAVPMHKFLCTYCLGVFLMRKARDNHVRYCTENPRKSEIAEECKRKNDEGAFCKRCKHTFKKKDTFSKHPCRRGLESSRADEDEE